MIEKPYKIAYGWITFFCCIAIPMFLFTETIKQNEILKVFFVGTMFYIVFISPLVGLWFLNETRDKNPEEVV